MALEICSVRCGGGALQFSLARSRFSEGQVIGTLREVKSGTVRREVAKVFGNVIVVQDEGALKEMNGLSLAVQDDFITELIDGKRIVQISRDKRTSKVTQIALILKADS